jgi:hypothetical protein
MRVAVFQRPSSPSAWMRSGAWSVSAGTKTGFMAIYMVGLDYRMRKIGGGQSVLARFKGFDDEFTHNGGAAGVCFFGLMGHWKNSSTRR